MYFLCTFLKYDILLLGNVMTYNVTGLTTGTLYYFNVIAVNDVGEGPKSETAVIQTGI